MKKIAFLMAFLATMAYAMPTFAAASPTSGSGSSSSNSGSSSSSSSSGSNIPASSGSEVVKTTPFTPVEALNATKDNEKNSVTINF